ncbi:hypothetical protein EJ06DRAFT_519001 [Trichodelitschia bisporula]|uniref:Myb-like DNA-binding domain-containing protein n=1 Tax=Trichodelitschia bisporula TaxID=703511 RepID=A0A6G1I9B1_9PEZI|nr:hypothetical protein EJ06DRAFT_519001 [Trichodelitschia bisporula]
MPTDKQNVEFLYAIIKQLEVKHIDWSIVASSNSISNGHAARMRFHRLRKVMDDLPTRQRSTPADGKGKKGMKGKKVLDDTSEDEPIRRTRIKRRLSEADADAEFPTGRRVKREKLDVKGEVKDEDVEEDDKSAVKTEIGAEPATDQASTIKVEAVWSDPVRMRQVVPQ